MDKKFQFRYQNTKGLEIQPAMPTMEKDAFEQRHNVKAAAFFNRFSENTTYVLALLTDDGRQLLRGLIIADAA